LNRRTKESNLSEVGQIRRRKGISTKMRTTPVTLLLVEVENGENKQMMEKMMRREAWKMLAIPRAIQTK